MIDNKSRERRTLDRVAAAIIITALLSLLAFALLGAYSLFSLVL